jgi:hypothetical protein
MVGIPMATPKAKKMAAKKRAPKKRAPKKTAAKKMAAKSPAPKKVTAKKVAAKKPSVAPRGRAAKKAKAAPTRRSAKGSAAVTRKAATKRAAAKPVAPARKVPAKKKTRATQVARSVKPAARPSVARARPVQRRDNAGHINPKYAAELLEMSEPHEKDPRAFLDRPRSSDDLVEELGEEFVQEVTSAEYKAEDVLNQDVPEDVGGPFVETGGATEFAPGTDPSNPASATREPFPST